jgi:hypothetical protein
MKKFEDNIKNKLFDLEHNADDNLWKNIEQKLPPAKPTVYSFYWLQVPGILAITIAILMLLQNGETSTNENQPKFSDSKKETQAGLLPAIRQKPLPTDQNSEKNDLLDRKTTIDESQKQKSRTQAQLINKNKKQTQSVDLGANMVVNKPEILINKESNTGAPVIKSDNDNIALVSKKGWTNIEWQLPATAIEKVEVKSAPEVIIPDEKVKSAWSLFAEANPMFLYRQITPNTNDDIRIVDLEEQSPLSLERSGYQLRLGSKYQLNKRWALKAGFNYQYNRNQLKYQYQTAADSFQIISSDQSFTFQPFSSNETATIDQSDHMYGFMAGIAYRRGSTMVQNYNLELQGMHDGSVMKYFVAFDINLEKPFNDYWSAYAGPALMWEVNNPDFNNQPYSLKTYSIGLRFGLKYNIHFNKK